MREEQIRYSIQEELNSKNYKNKWFTQEHPNKEINDFFKNSSKNLNGNRGYPDLIYYNEYLNLLIIGEVKNDINKHYSSNNKENASMYCIDGLKNYLNSILNKEINVVGFAFSGKNDEKMIDTFIIKNKELINIGVNELLDEKKYASYFEKHIETNLTKLAVDISVKLRDFDISSAQRSILISGLMICIYEKEGEKFSEFKQKYKSWNKEHLELGIFYAIENTLNNEGIPKEKINVLLRELEFLKGNNIKERSEDLKFIIEELITSILPIINIEREIDVIGKFYETFLKYAGLYNVKGGIVLTPRHITTLFTKLIPLEINDIIMDPACGTGSFLISGMNALIEKIEAGNYTDKEEKKKNVAKNQLLGFEKNPMMYILSISNMLFRHDGKSSIYNYDFFKKEALEKMEVMKPTIGFINPPYSGMDSEKNSTKKEIQFIKLMLSNVSRYGVVITPHSTLFNDIKIRNEILKNNKLLKVISMPSTIFQPTATIGTSILIFQTNISHNFNENVKFYNLKSDGFVLNKSNGRLDLNDKWTEIEKKILDDYSEESNYFEKKITLNSTWTLNEFMETNINDNALLNKNFLNKIINYKIFIRKNDLNMELSWNEIYDLLGEINFNVDEIHLTKFKSFELNEIFDIDKIFMGQRMESNNIIYGAIPFITAKSKNNGVSQEINIENSINKKGIKLFLHSGNKITIDKFGNSFYQKNEFVASDSVAILETLINCNEYIGIFLATILDLEKERYSFGYSLTPKKMIEKIKLPSIIKNNIYVPDWEYMTKFIKSFYKKK